MTYVDHRFFKTGKLYEVQAGGIIFTPKPLFPECSLRHHTRIVHGEILLFLGMKKHSHVYSYGLFVLPNGLICAFTKGSGIDDMPEDYFREIS